MKYTPIVLEPQPARTIPKTDEAFFVWLDGSNMPVTVRFHRIGFRRTWDHSVVQEHEIIAWARIPNLIKADVPCGSPSDFWRGILAAANQLEETAADYEEMSGRVNTDRAEIGHLSKLAEKKLLLEKAALLRGQATHIRNLKP
jgi:hypothetical protein